MNVVIFGGGSMGLAYAGLLGPDATIFVRRREQQQAITKKGITLETSAGQQLIKVLAVSTPKDLKNADIIIMLVKNYDSENAAKLIAKHAKKSCIIITTESGIGVEEIYKKLCSLRKIIRAVSYFGCKKISDTETHVGDNRNIVVQRPDEDDEMTTALLDSMEQSGFEITLSDDIDAIVWKKMIVVTAQQAASALTGMTFGQLLASEDALSLAEHLVGELEAVAKKERIHLPENTMEIVRNNWKSLPDHKSSMYQDLMAGRPTEIDMMNGSILRLGKKHGIPTPYNDVITKLIHLRQQVI